MAWGDAMFSSVVHILIECTYIICRLKLYIWLMFELTAQCINE
jgi:hypothetical protein